MSPLHGIGAMWLLLLLWLEVALSGEPCWEAVLRCQEDRECGSAYVQSEAACQAVAVQGDPPLGGGDPPLCPSRCTASLVRLNRSRSGAALERCDCGEDVRCSLLKASLEPCLPPPSRAGRGCTSARARCQQLPSCRAPLEAYLARCGQLFNGRRCSASCRAAIGLLRASPGGAELERCDCDGTERRFCLLLKHNMGRLCSGTPQAPEEPLLDYPDEDLQEEQHPREPPARGSARLSCPPAWQGLALGGILWLFRG